MAETTEMTVPFLLAAYPFDAYPTVVDVGGGIGRLLAAILTATPTAHGVLYDLPQAVAKPQRCCASTQSDRMRVEEVHSSTALPPAVISTC